jgi:hypothetical protein
LSLHILFPHLRGFRLFSLDREAKRLVLICERVTSTALCPVCGVPAHRIHSRYQRTVWDLSVQNVQVVLHLHVRKFYCDQQSCPRRIFAERLPQVTSPHGRFTFGLRQFLAQLGREHGGASGLTGEQESMQPPPNRSENQVILPLTFICCISNPGNLSFKMQCVVLRG